MHELSGPCVGRLSWFAIVAIGAMLVACVPENDPPIRSASGAAVGNPVEEAPADLVSPTAVLEVADEQGRLLIDGQISFGSGFILSGRDSTDNDGGSGIVSYIWSALDSPVTTAIPSPLFTDVVGPLLPGTPIVTTDSQLMVQFPDEKLPVGEHRFQLEVIDAAGNVSAPAVTTVYVVDVTAPTAVLTLADENGRPITDGKVAFGSGFILNGSQSSDIGGEIAEYSWTRMVPVNGGMPSPVFSNATGPLVPGTPVVTTDNHLVLQYPDEKLPVGTHLYQLQVLDTSGNVSAPSQTAVTVIDTTAPTAVIDLHDSQGVPVSDGRISFGATFGLSGERSVDIGSGIAEYLWTYVDGGGTTPSAVSTAVTVEQLLAGPLSTTDATLVVEQSGAKLTLGPHHFELLVRDHNGNESRVANLTAIVIDDLPPTAVLDLLTSDGIPIADRRVPFGAGFILSGARSTDVGGSLARYIWEYVDPNPPSPSPLFTVVTLERILSHPAETTDSALTIDMPDEKLPLGAHLFWLTVEDDSGNASSPAQITAIVVDREKPTAVLDLRDVQGVPLPNNEIDSGSGFTLVGSRSTDTGGGTIGKYTWFHIDGPTPAPSPLFTQVTWERFLESPLETVDSTLTVVQPNAKLLPGHHIFALVVEDDSGNRSIPSQATLRVLDPPNLGPPVANAGADIVLPCAEPSCNATLDASGSSDPDGFGDIVRFTWTEVTGTPVVLGEILVGADVLLPSEAQITVDLSLGLHQVRLEVEDSVGQVSTDTVTVDITPSGLAEFTVTRAEVNLHKRRVSVRGRLLLPEGRSPFDVAASGTILLELPQPVAALDNELDFSVRGFGTKWIYPGKRRGWRHLTSPFKRLHLFWHDGRLQYDGMVSISSTALGEEETVLTIGLGELAADLHVSVCGADFTVGVDGDVTGPVPSASGTAGSVEVSLDCSLNATDTIVLNSSNGALDETLIVGEHTTGWHGTFDIFARFEELPSPQADASLRLSLTLGDEAFSGTFAIGPGDDAVPWTSVRQKKWTYRE